MISVCHFENHGSMILFFSDNTLPDIINSVGKSENMFKTTLAAKMYFKIQWNYFMICLLNGRTNLQYDDICLAIESKWRMDWTKEEMFTSQLVGLDWLDRFGLGWFGLNWMDWLDRWKKKCLKVNWLGWIGLDWIGLIWLDGLDERRNV